MRSIDDKLDVLKSPAYQKMMKKNKQQKNKKKLKKIGLFIITNVIIPIIVSMGTVLITMLFTRL